MWRRSLAFAGDGKVSADRFVVNVYREVAESGLVDREDCVACVLVHDLTVSDAKDRVGCSSSSEMVSVLVLFRVHLDVGAGRYDGDDDGFVYLSYVVVDQRDWHAKLALVRGDGQRRGRDNVIIIPGCCPGERQ